jgi:hypothetical protein
VVSMIRFFFKQPLRATQGFTGSLMELLGFDLPVPDYSTLSRRMKKLEVKLGKLKSKGKRIHVVLDSTGLKVFGEGEWKVRQHGLFKKADLDETAPSCRRGRWGDFVNVIDREFLQRQ